MADQELNKQNDAGQSDPEMGDSEMISFGLIASAGQARSLAFEALKAAERGEFDQARDYLAQSEEVGLQAHHVQTDLLTQEAQGNHLPVDVLLIHAQDHLMTSILARELIADLVKVREQLAQVETQLAEQDNHN